MAGGTPEAQVRSLTPSIWSVVLRQAVLPVALNVEIGVGPTPDSESIRWQRMEVGWVVSAPRPRAPLGRARPPADVRRTGAAVRSV